MVHHKVCPLCASENISLQFKCTDHFLSREIFGVWRCSACTFEFTQDYPDEAETGSYYESEEYISHSDTSEGFSNKLYRLARKIMLHRKKGLVKKITGLQTGTLLDIGSGTGHFANAMKEAGWQVTAIEINAKARDFSVSKFGLEATAPDQISTLDADSFACITLWHVLEHFHDPFNYASKFIVY
jgi:2-polyprenyl-3-methyl-5-hydroxy-6-metoxy-1,4-benzoquinol methylase